MHTKQLLGVLCLTSAGLWMAGCGGGGSTPPPPQRTTPVVTVTPATSSVAAGQTLTVTVSVSGTNGTPTGTVTLASGTYTSAGTTLNGGSASITIPANTLAVGTANLSSTYTPDAGSSATYNGASGNGSATVTAIVPNVSVSPGSSNLTTTQVLAVTVTVTGNGTTTPTGSVTLTSGGYASAATVLSNGSATITIPAGTLALGGDTLTARYTADTAGAMIYANATGTNSVTVSLATPSVTVTPASNSITPTQPLAVTVSVSGGNGSPTPTGSVTLTSGSYSSAATVLSSGSSTINIPAGSLATGSNTLTARYTPDTAGAAVYASATGSSPVTIAAVYILTLDSAAPSSGITISASPADNNSVLSGMTPFTLTYNAGTQLTLNAPLGSGSYTFVSWSGCASTSGTSGSVCNIVLNANTTVTATYNQPSITVSPNSATIGTQQQFTATLKNLSGGATWSVSAPSGSNLSPGTISSTGLYNTPYPAPPTVTVTATSTQNTSVHGSVTVSLNPPATAAGPTLNVDVNTPNMPNENPHAINPYIYGVNGYLLDSASEKTANFTLVRWGGDGTSRYNYQNGSSNSVADYYFKNAPPFAMFPNTGTGENFLQFFPAVDAAGAATLGTVPVNGWVSNGVSACSFTNSAYPGQESYVGSCGNGVYADGSQGCTDSGGCEIFGNSTVAAITSNPEPPPDITQTSATPTSTQVPSPGSVTTGWADSTWSGAWVNSIAGNSGFGSGASGKGVAMWDLDNEPTWWDFQDRDVHPDPFTYDEVTNNGIGTALAIKTADPTALVAGPVIDYWWAYFYSKKDIEQGWTTGPCYEAWSSPTDRTAHGGVPMIEYYLQQFAKYSGSSYYNTRLLDYLDIHGYFAPLWPPNNTSGTTVAFTTAGDTQEQEARMNGTRVFWDPTYTDPNYQQPNYTGDSNYTTSCSPPAQAPELIPMMQSWVSKDYPGTQTAIDEYNFGGLESINGAVVQADILGIFGRQGLGMGAMWPTGTNSKADSVAENPANFAFAMYRNYDGNDSMFGDTYLQATSTITGGGDGENQLAVYAAQRSTDHAITVIVINKTFGSLTSTINLGNFAAASGTNAQVYQYSSANLGAIVPQTAVSVTPPTGSGTSSTLSDTFPAQSITLFVVPN